MYTPILYLFTLVKELSIISIFLFPILYAVTVFCYSVTWMQPLLIWYQSYTNSGNHWSSLRSPSLLFFISASLSLSIAFFFTGSFQWQHRAMPISQRMLQILFYLHPNGNPSLVLVTPPLTDKNYHTWARSMHIALISKNKEKFIDETLNKPPMSDPMFEPWICCNTMVLAWIHLSISELIAKSVL